MKVGLFTDTYFPQTSGVATSIQTLKRELEKQGHQVYIFTTTDPESIEEEGVYRFESIPFIFFKERRVAVTTLWPVYRLAKKLDLDIIHTQTEFSMGIMGVMAARKLQIPVVHTYHTWYENYIHYILNGHLVSKAAVRAYTRFFCSLVQQVISPSEMIKEVLTSYRITQPITVIPTGVALPDPLEESRIQNLRERLGLGDDHLMLLSVNRIAQEKNLDTLIQWMPEVLHLVPKARLVLVGDGPEKESLEKLTHSLGLDEEVQFTGMIPHEEVQAYYQAADLYCNLSVTETQGITFIEALANGLPLIAMKNDYLLSLEKRAPFGRLLEHASDFPEAVADYADHREDFCGNVEVLKREISQETFGQRILDLYQRLIKEEKNQQDSDDSSFLKKISENIWPFS